MLNELKGSRKSDFAKLIRRYPDLTLYWETLAAVGAVTGFKRVMDYAYAKEGGEVPMWAAVEHFEKEMEERVEKRVEKRLEKAVEKRVEKRVKEPYLSKIKEQAEEINRLKEQIEKMSKIERQIEQDI